MHPKNISQDELIKNLLRDYPEDALAFLCPEIVAAYGVPGSCTFHLQEIKKHSHFDRNLRHDLAISYSFPTGDNVVLTLFEHWSVKAGFDIHRFAHYLLDLHYRFPGYEIVPVALFTDSTRQWHKKVREKLVISCLHMTYLTFTYKMIRLKDYQAAHFADTKNKCIAVLRAAMNWREQHKIALAAEIIERYNCIERNTKIIIKNIAVIEYYFKLSKEEKKQVQDLLQQKEGGTSMLFQEYLQQGLQQGMQKARIAMVRNMLKEGLAVRLIARVSGLSIAQIKELE